MYKFHREKYWYATGFTKKNPLATSSIKKINFTSRKSNVQDSAREISTCNRFYGKKSARTMFQEQNKSALTDLNEQNYFHEEKNQCTSFTKRKNQHAKSFTNKIRKFHEEKKKSTSKKLNDQKSGYRKLHEQKKISTQWIPRTKLASPGKKKSMYKFHKEKNQHATSFTNKKQDHQVPWTKISTQQVEWTKSVSRGEKSVYTFYEEKNYHATGFHKQKSPRNKFHEQKSTRNKIHEQNQFHEENNRGTSFRKRKIKMQLVSRTKISTQKVSRTKSVSRREK